MRILLLDIETAPHKTYVYGLWGQNIGTHMLIEPGQTLCWSAKWHDEKEVMFQSLQTNTPRGLAIGMHKLIDEADAVVHYNGNRFDMPTLQKDFLLQRLRPPSPVKPIDLYRVVKKEFRFPSYKLDYVCQALGIGRKVKHEGIELWKKCMAGDDAAWGRMAKYNEQDVKLLEKLYIRLKPWIRNHPNHGLYNPDNSLVCPACGHDKYQRRGTAMTGASVYHRFQCMSCGKWFRSVKNVGPKQSERFANAA
jgi:DNA polymerase elongation subunit (family B)